MPTIGRWLIMCKVVVYLINIHLVDPMHESPHEHLEESVNDKNDSSGDTTASYFTNGPWNGTEVSKGTLTVTSTQETTRLFYEHECASESYQPEAPKCNNKTFTGSYRAYTCNGRCDDPNINLKGGPYCSCHQLCLISKDCCIDFQKFCWKAYKRGEKIKQISEASEAFVGPECRQLFGSSHKVPHWIVTHCPENYNNSKIKSNCEGPPIDFTSIVPVASTTTGLSYKNHFCAHCNNITDIIPWGLNATCKDVWEGSIDSPQALRRYIIQGYCELNYISHIGHVCLDVSQEVAILPPSCHGNMLGCSRKHVNLCENGFQMPISVRIFGLNGFKNIHCLICKLGFQPSLRDIDCTIYSIPSESVLPDDLSKFSFGILVDFSLEGGGTNVGFDFKDASKLFGCKSESPECVSYCLDGYDYINGKCVFKYQLFPLTLYGSWFSPGLMEYIEHLRWTYPYTKDPKTDIVIFLSNMLDEVPVVVDNILITISETDAEQWDDGNQKVRFSCEGKYKLKADNKLSKAQIHSNIFNSFVHQLKHYYGRPYLNLLTMCFGLFERHSCWQYGRIDHYGNALNDSNSSVAINSTDFISSEILNKTDCPRKSLNSQTFDLLTNGSLFLILTETVLSADQFVLVGNTVYVCVNETEYKEKQIGDWKFDNTMGLLTIICSALSLVCLAIRLALQPMVPLYQNFPGKLQCSLVLALFIAGAFFLIGPNCSNIEALCITLGVLIHWGYLAAFTWTVIIARDMYTLFGPSGFSHSSERDSHVFIIYSVIGWVLPGIIVATAIGLDFSNIDPLYKPMYGRGGLCWVTQRYPLMIFFTLPIAITIFLNTCFFIPTAITLWKSMSKRAETTHSKRAYPVGIYAKLFCLMGFTWIFAFIAPYNVAFWYIFIVLNSSQGLYIFLAFVLTKKVWISLSSKGTLHNGPPKTSSTIVSTIQNQNTRV